MGTLPGTCEIVEAEEELSANERVRKHYMSRQGRVYSIEDDIDQLFNSVNIKTSIKGKALQKNPMKQPVRPNSPQPFGIEVSESVSLKQALRGLCISQASEMAAMKKRSLKSSGSSRMSEAEKMNRLHKTAVMETKGSSSLPGEAKNTLVEFSFPGKVVVQLSETMPESTEISAPSSSKQSHVHSTAFARTLLTKTKVERVPSQEKIVPLVADDTCETSNTQQVKIKNSRLKESLHGICTVQRVLEMDDLGVSEEDKGIIHMFDREPYPTSDSPDENIKNTKSSSSSCLMRPVFRNRSFTKRKAKGESVSASRDSPTVTGLHELVNKPHSIKLEDKTHSKRTAELNSGNARTMLGSITINSEASNEFSSNSVGKVDCRSRSREKGEFSQSSKSSIGEYSTSTSEESSGSGSNRCNRPHMSKDMKWEAVNCVQKQLGFLSLRHFKLLKRLGSGDIGTVYLAELVGSHCLFALKVMDNDFLARRKKLTRAQTERETLQMLDHPFLPTLYAHFTTDKLSCLVMEYCPGGDLHVIRQKQPSRCFSEQAARFYVAEVLLALEYLHMLGIVYRDLKPENILVREDGHIMLSDFDLSLRCIVNPTLLTSSSTIPERANKVSSTSCSQSSCIDPFCLQPTWQASCFTPRLLVTPSRSRQLKSEQVSVTHLPQLVAEPTDARSNSFVGTHEYLAPEIVKGDGHGSAVDWWTYGIFLFELLYGRTPFKGSSNEDTLANVVSQPLKFPETPLVSFHAKDLIRGLLMKQPENRLGYVRGASEIKQHPFFEGLNWALIRCAVPPERPKLCDVTDVGNSDTSRKKQNGHSLGASSSDHIEFELF